MKNVYIFILMGMPVLVLAQPCSVSNASGCHCPDGTDTCTLLPDLTISWLAMQSYLGGPKEYSQTGNGADNGRLRVSSSTPNIGYGAFTVLGSGYYMCGTDTFYAPGGNFSCPSPWAGTAPRQLLHQRIYTKNGATMTYDDRWAGSQTYHPTHGHNHVDDWVYLTLRRADPSEPDTLKWPLVGQGAKLGFCLMDYGTCSYYNGHCRSEQPYGGGTVLTNGSFPNFGLGGGSYSCSPIEQGISVGYTDIYSESLDGMWVNVPPGTCNGDYWIVAQVDINDDFLESNENNNWTATPFTLTKQVPAGSATAEVAVAGEPYLCNNSSLDLSANLADAYLWSTGDTSRGITITQPGNYWVEIASQCGTASDTVVIQNVVSEIAYTIPDSSCVQGALTLSAGGTGDLYWYASSVGGIPIDTGSTFETPLLQTTTDYYVENINRVAGAVSFSEPHNHQGSNFSGTQYNGYVIFDCFSNFTLRSVLVYTDDAANRTIELRNSSGTVLADTTVYINAGSSRVNLNFNVTPGTDLQLGTNENDNIAAFGYESPALRRSSSGVNYPYTTSGLFSLTGSPYGNSYYYYFYDWEVETGAMECVSSREPVSAYVFDLPQVDFTGLDSIIQISQGVMTLTGQPAGGTFSGPGVTGSIFDPASAGIGTYLITYNYADSNGCSNIATKQTRVISGTVVADAGNDAAICNGASTVLSASGASNYAWSNGALTDTTTVSPAATTTYSVTVSNNFGDQDVDYVTVTVHPLPAVSFSGLEAEYFIDEASVMLTGSPAGGTFSGQGVSGDYFTPADAGIGTHTVIYSYTDSNQCFNSESKTVVVRDTVSVGIDDPDVFNSIGIYPNPTEGVINIEFHKHIIAEVNIALFNAMGNEIAVSNIPGRVMRNTIHRMDISAFSRGLYLVKLSTSDRSVMLKVVKE